MDKLRFASMRRQCRLGDKLASRIPTTLRTADAQPEEDVDDPCQQLEDFDQQREFETIKENAEFMEGIDEIADEHNKAEDQIRKRQTGLELVRDQPQRYLGQ
ncbi:hypothetical protein Aduo_013206 [Ancylostoma duodenale]